MLYDLVIGRVFWFYVKFVSIQIITFIELHNIIMLQSLCFETKNVSVITINSVTFGGINTNICIVYICIFKIRILF